MFKSLILKYLDNIFIRSWKILKHKNAFAVTFLVFASLFIVVVSVKIPYREQTVLDIAVYSYFENWRLHANSTELSQVERREGILRDECTRIERYLRDLRISKYQIKGSTMSDLDKAKELEEIIYHKSKAEKKLYAAEQRLEATTSLYEQLMATR